MIALNPGNDHDVEFNFVFRRLFDEIATYARKRGIDRCFAIGGGLNAEDSDDFAQSCLIEYSEAANRDQFRTVQKPLLWRIVKNRLIDSWRKRDRANRFLCRIDMDSAQVKLHDVATANWSRGDQFTVGKRVTETTGSPSDSELGILIGGLSDKAADILRLCHVAEISHREVAVVMGMTIDGVRSSLKRSRKRIRASLGDRKNRVARHNSS